MALTTIWLNETVSTQSYLIEKLKSNELELKVAVGTDRQTLGKGRRGDAWEFFEGSLALSVAIKNEDLPRDMPITAGAIFAGFILLKTLRALGSKCWMKWPNDLYLEDKKLAGIIASPVANGIVFGVGINGSVTDNAFAKSDVIFEPKKLANAYIFDILGVYEWGSLFMEIEVELQNNLGRLREFYTLGVAEIEICVDGALMIDGRKVYTLR